MKTSIIDNREYRYSPDKPLTNKLATFLRHMPLEKRGNYNWCSKCCQGFYQCWHKFKNEQKHKKKWTVSHILLLSLKRFEKHKGIELNAAVKLAVQNIFEGQELTVRTRSITNEEESRVKICFQQHETRYRNNNLDMALYQSGLVISKVVETHIMHSKYHPTRAGKYIQLPAFVRWRMHVATIKT